MNASNRMAHKAALFLFVHLLLCDVLWPHRMVKPAFSQVPEDQGQPVTAADALAALKSSVEEGAATPRHDADGDGVLTSNDARLLLQRAIGKSTPLPLPQPGALNAGAGQAPAAVQAEGVSADTALDQAASDISARQWAHALATLQQVAPLATMSPKQMQRASSLRNQAETGRSERENRITGLYESAEDFTNGRYDQCVERLEAVLNNPEFVFSTDDKPLLEKGRTLLANARAKIEASAAAAKREQVEKAAAAEEAQKQKEQQAATEAAKKRQDDHEAQCSAMNTFGVQSEAKGYAQEALSWYEKAAKCDPNNPLYKNNIASIRQKLGSAEKDKKCDALFDKGLAQGKTGDSQGAIGAYKQLLSLCPDNCSAMNNLGTQFDALGKKSDAISWFEKAVKCDPGEEMYRNNVKSTQNELASQNSKSQCDVLFTKGLTQNKAGDHQRAIGTYKQLLSLCSNYCSAMNNIGAIHFDTTNNANKALPWFEKALACDPNDALYRKNVAKAKNAEQSQQQTPKATTVRSVPSENAKAPKSVPTSPANTPPRPPKSSGNSSSITGSNDRECERLANEASCRGKRGDLAGNQALIRKTMELCPNGWKPSPAFNPYCK